MPAPTPIIFTVTDAGRLAALDAENNGLTLRLATLRASTGQITPDGTETGLTGTLRASWVLGGGAVEPTTSTMRFFALVQSSVAITDIFSLGIYTDTNVLFAIASTTSSDPLIVCFANIDFAPSFGVRLPGIAASSITIETDPNAPLAQSLMTAHQAASDPHPQYRNALTPPGVVMAYAAQTPPDGWLECNGSVVSRNAYAALYAAIGTTFNTGGESSTQFRLPDLRGEFIRGFDNNREVDDGRVFGSSQADAMQGHRHAFSSTGADSGFNTAGGGQGVDPGPWTVAAFSASIGDPTTDGTNGTPRTAAETRPRNIALLYMIKT